MRSFRFDFVFVDLTPLSPYIAHNLIEHGTAMDARRVQSEAPSIARRC